MEVYKKQCITSNDSLKGLLPALLAIGKPVIIAAGVLAALSKKGDEIIDSTHTNALTARKDFTLA